MANPKEIAKLAILLRNGEFLPPIREEYGSSGQAFDGAYGQRQLHLGAASRELVRKTQEPMNAPVLQALDPEEPVVMSADSSGWDKGAVLEKNDGTGRRSVAFSSQALNVHEQIYNIRERELLAIVQATRPRRCYHHGRSFVIRMDHESLHDLKTHDKQSDGQVRWHVMMEQYDSTIILVPC